MERKNTVLLTVIAVATLLVAVVGATFAYFTATNPSAPDVSKATGEATTAKVAGITLSSTNIAASNEAIWPGTKNYVGTSVKAEKTGEGTTDDEYTVSYTVKGTVQATEAFTKGDVTWNLYETTSPVDKPVTCSEVSNADNKYSQTCTLNETLTSASVANGTLDGTTASPVEYTRGSVTTGGDTKYYYLVVGYENDPDTNQNDDAGGTKTINYSFTEVTVTSTAVAGA